LALVVIATVFGAALRAQEQPAAQPSSSLQVQVVISRYQGDKKISSLPYSLSVDPGRKTSLRMGAEVPVVTMTVPSPAGRGEKLAPPASSISYRSIGTMIDCSANAPIQNQYRLTLDIEDSSVYPDDPRSPKGAPMFRSFKLSNTLQLKDGQSSQLTSASDKVSGEVLKVDVTLIVVK
jgi:hypothetical protein